MTNLRFFCELRGDSPTRELTREDGANLTDTFKALTGLDGLQFSVQTTEL